MPSYPDDAKKSTVMDYTWQPHFVCSQVEKTRLKRTVPLELLNYGVTLTEL
jgi:hypothetical protein